MRPSVTPSSSPAFDSHGYSNDLANMALLCREPSDLWKLYQVMQAMFNLVWHCLVLIITSKSYRGSCSFYFHFNNKKTEDLPKSHKELADDTTPRTMSCIHPFSFSPSSQGPRCSRLGWQLFYCSAAKYWVLWFANRRSLWSTALNKVWPTHSWEMTAAERKMWPDALGVGGMHVQSGDSQKRKQWQTGWGKRRRKVQAPWPQATVWVGTNAFRIHIVFICPQHLIKCPNKFDVFFLLQCICDIRITNHLEMKKQEILGSG